MIKIYINTPNGEVVNDDSDFVVARTDTGEMGFLENHAPLIARISNGYIRFNDKFVAIQGGIIDVNNNVINAICHYAEIGKSLEEANSLLKNNLDQITENNKRKMVDFAHAEKELIKNIKKVRASKI